MILRKKHAAVATVCILILLIVFALFLLMRPEKVEPQIVDTPILTISDTVTTVSVSSDTNKERQQQAGARLKSRLTSVETGG